MFKSNVNMNKMMVEGKEDLQCVLMLHDFNKYLNLNITYRLYVE